MTWYVGWGDGLDPGLRRDDGGMSDGVMDWILAFAGMTSHYSSNRLSKRRSSPLIGSTNCNDRASSFSGLA